VSGSRLDVKDESILRVGLAIRALGGRGTFLNAGKRRARIRVSVDNQQRPWRNEREHRWRIEFGMDAGDDAVVELAKEVRVDRRDPGVARRTFERCLKRAGARLPGIVVQRPSEALHSNHRHGDGDSGIHGGG